MKQENLLNVLNFITTVNCPDEQKKALLEMAANTITVDRLSALMGGDNSNKDKASENVKVGIVKFTKKEISQMPTTFRKNFQDGGLFGSRSAPQKRKKHLELYDPLSPGRLQHCGDLEQSGRGKA